MAELWAAYGRVISQTKVGIVVCTTVMVINVAIILASRMWTASLESDVGKLWINPASAVAANNIYVATYGSPFAKTNLELYTFTPVDGSNAGTKVFFTKWMNLNRKVYYDTVIVINGTAYTVYDVCVPRLGQSSYNFGCTQFNAVDYFSEAQFENPVAASAQWILDYKTANYELIPELVAALSPTTFPTIGPAIGAAVGGSWGWAFTADLLLSKTGTPASGLPALGWFKSQCQDTKLFLCREKPFGSVAGFTTMDTGANKLYDDFEAILNSTGVPYLLKFQIGFSKAQLILGAIRIQQTLATLDTCSNWSTTANTQTAPITSLLAGAIAVGTSLSMDKCGVAIGGGNCPGAFCDGASYNSLTSASFNSSMSSGTYCGQCVVAMQWWLGDLARMGGDGPVATFPTPADRFPTAIPGTGPIFSYFGSLGGLSGFFAKAYFNGAAVQTCTTAFPIVNTLSTNPYIGVTQAKVDTCVAVWIGAKNLIVAGTASATPDMTVVLGHATTIGYALATAFPGNPLALNPIAQLDAWEIATSKPVRIYRNQKWIAALKLCTAISTNGACSAPLVSSTISVVNRHVMRPTIAAHASDAALMVSLSTNTNDLLSQLLKPTMFGGTTPALSQMHGGTCQCASGVAGAQCTVKFDGICDCDERLLGQCVPTLLSGCTPYITCASFSALLGLAGYVTGNPAVSPTAQASLIALPKIVEIGGAFQEKATLMGGYFAIECSRYLPCVDSEWAVTNNPTGILPYAPVDWIPVLGDASWVVATVGDLSTGSSVNRGNLVAGGALGVLAAMTGSPTAAPTVAGLLSIGSVAERVYQSGDVSKLAACMNLAGKSIANCNSITYNIGTAWSSGVICPLAYAAAVAAGAPNIYHHFLCIVEEGGNPLSRTGVALAVWPRVLTGGVKAGACAFGKSTPPLATQVNETACINTYAYYTMSAAEKLSANYSAFGLPAAQNVINFLAGGATTTARSAAQLSATGTALTGTLASFTTFVNGILPFVWSGNTTTRSTDVNIFLASQCAFANALPTNLKKGACQTLFANIVGALSPFAGPAKDYALYQIGLALAPYKVVATFLGACSKTVTGNQLGGADCWYPSDCKANTTYLSVPLGSCNMSSSNPFTRISSFAAVIQTATPQAIKSNLHKKTARLYRALANLPILRQYNLTYGPLESFGELNDHVVSVETAAVIVKHWRLKLLSVVAAFQLTDSAVKVDTLTTDASSDVLESFSNGDTSHIILGYVLMIIYAQLTLINWSTNMKVMLNSSRGMIGSAGIILVAFSVASGLGITLFMGLKWSTAATQIIPFIMLALGVSDVFVLIRVFPLYRDGVSAQEACATGMSIAGPSTFLVALTNAAVFSVGVLTGMPVVVVFAMQAAIISGTNYVTINTVMPFLLAVDYSRQARGLMECPPCLAVGTAPQPDRKDGDEVDRNFLNAHCIPAYSNFWLSSPGKIFGLLITLGFIVTGAVGTASAQLGLTLADIAPAGSSVASALLIRDQYFPFYTVTVFTGVADYSQPSVQQAVASLWAEINGSPHIVAGSGTPWIQAMGLWGLPTLPFYDQKLTNIDGSARVCNSGSSSTGGYCGSSFNCEIVTSAFSVVKEKKTPFFNQTDFYRCLGNWVNYDVTFDILNPGIAFVDPDAAKPTRVLKFVNSDPSVLPRQLPVTSGTFIAKNLATNEDFVAVIQETRTITSNYTASFNAFPYGTPVDYWDQYFTLRQVIQDAIGYSLLICFVCTFILLFILAKSDNAGPGKKLIVAIWASALMTGIIAMSVFEVYGFMVWSNLRISAIPAISIIMMTGVAVEYTAYISISFINAPGDRTERARHALDVMMAPTVDGAVTMLLGTLLLAASPFTFIVKYFFYVWLLIIFFGLFNGILALPIIFSLVGPPALTVHKGQGGGQIVAKD